MVDRTFKLLIEQLVHYLSDEAAQEEQVFVKWCQKMLKCYKALRLMEAHKSEEPRFARNLKLIYPHLLQFKQPSGTGLNTSNQNINSSDTIEKEVEDIAAEFEKAGREQAEGEEGYDDDEAKPDQTHYQSIEVSEQKQAPGETALPQITS